MQGKFSPYMLNFINRWKNSPLAPGKVVNWRYFCMKVATILQRKGWQMKAKVTFFILTKRNAGRRIVTKTKLRKGSTDPSTDLTSIPMDQDSYRPLVSFWQLDPRKSYFSNMHGSYFLTFVTGWNPALLWCLIHSALSRFMKIMDL